VSAVTLNCPGCGAPAASDATSCPYCKSRLATVACPGCFGMVFAGSKHCQHCGAAVARQEQAEPESLPCPRCRTGMPVVAVGASRVRECAGCGGLWLDPATFEAVCSDRERQASVLGLGERTAIPAEEQVRYLPCPVCAALMARSNFKRVSGVVVDVCRAHGAWFDRDELRGIVEFIRGGGLDLAREREAMKVEEDLRRLVLAQSDPARGGISAGAADPLDATLVRGLLGLLGDR